MPRLRRVAGIVTAKESAMSDPQKIYRCATANCGYMYDPDRGDRKGKIPKGTLFADLPDGWRCPVCGAGKKAFAPMLGNC